MSYQRGGKSLQRCRIKKEMFRMFFISLFSRLLQSGSGPLSLSLSFFESGPVPLSGLPGRG